MYNHPRESIFYKQKDYYSTLEQVDQFLANYTEQGQEFELLLGGDLNARISDWAYTEDEDPDTNDGPTTYERESQDIHINIPGRTLIEMCTTFGLTSISGLKMKNFLSKFTFIGHRGSSIVDHFITSVELIDNITEFITADRIESNHLPIILKMESNLDDLDSSENESHEPYVRTKWQDTKVTESQNILEKKETKKLIKTAEELVETNIDESLKHFNLAMEAVNKPMTQTINPKDRKKRKDKNVWFDKDCTESKRLTKNCLRNLNKTNRRKNERVYEDRKQKYLQQKLEYNKLIKEKKKNYKKETQEKLIENRKDSKKFWDLIRKINFKIIRLPKIKLTEWKDYFCNRLNPKENPIANDDRISTYHETKIEELDKEISDIEILQAIEKQKNGKSAGIDGTSPELLKLAKPKISKYLKDLFNKVFETSYFPTDWITSIIVPIHKKGNKLLTDNYQGISLLSLTSKVFTSIINTRLYNC